AARVCREMVLFILLSFIVDRVGGGSDSSFGFVVLTKRPLATHADRADDLSVDANRNASLQWRRTGQRQCGYAPFLDLILEIFAGSAENGRGSRFSDSYLDARDLRIVEPAEQ